MPAVMRLYGTAPSVARTAMSSDVVLGFGIRAVLGGRHTVRHVTAPELAAAMGFHDWHTAAWTSHGGDDRRVLWPALGDTVSPPQALWFTLLLVRATQGAQLGSDPEVALRQYLVALRASLAAFRPDRPGQVLGLRVAAPAEDDPKEPQYSVPPLRPRSRSPRRPGGTTGARQTAAPGAPRHLPGGVPDPVATALARTPDEVQSASPQERRLAAKAARMGVLVESPPRRRTAPRGPSDTTGDARLARDLHVALNGADTLPAAAVRNQTASCGGAAPAMDRGVPTGPTAVGNRHDAAGETVPAIHEVVSLSFGTPSPRRGGDPISPTLSFHSGQGSLVPEYHASPQGRWVSPGGSRLPCSPTLSWNPQSPDADTRGVPSADISQEPASVQIRLPDGRFVPVRIHATDSVRTLRPFLAERTGIPPAHLTLALHSRTLREDTPLLDQGVDEASCLTVAVRLFGGGGSDSGPSPRRMRLPKRAADGNASPPHTVARNNEARGAEGTHVGGGPDASSISADLQELSLAGAEDHILGGRSLGLRNVSNIQELTGVPAPGGDGGPGTRSGLSCWESPCAAPPTAGTARGDNHCPVAPTSSGAAPVRQFVSENPVDEPPLTQWPGTTRPGAPKEPTSVGALMHPVYRQISRSFLSQGLRTTSWAGEA